MTFWNLASTDVPALDLQIYGVIGGGFFDGESVDAGELARTIRAQPAGRAIDVHINSIGGAALDGVAIYNALKAHPGRVNCIVEGQASSAASIVAMAGNVRMMRGALLMVHNPWGMVAGNAEDMRRTANMLDKVRDSLVAIYQAKTGKSPDELRTILDAETWMTPAEAKAHGFVDVIDDAQVPAALPSFAAAPRAASAVAFAAVSIGARQLNLGVKDMPPESVPPIEAATIVASDAAPVEAAPAPEAAKCAGCVSGVPVYCAACAKPAAIAPPAPMQEDAARAVFAAVGVDSLGAALGKIAALVQASTELAAFRADVAKREADARANALRSTMTAAVSDGRLTLAEITRVVPVLCGTAAAAVRDAFQATTDQTAPALIGALASVPLDATAHNAIGAYLDAKAPPSLPVPAAEPAREPESESTKIDPARASLIDRAMGVTAIHPRAAQ